MNHYIQPIRLTFIILMIVGLGFMQGARAAVDSIGVISVVIGEAEIVRANAQSEAISGAELFRNDLVKTGKASRVQVLLKDQTAVNLGQNAEIRLDEFVYSGAEPKVTLNVAKGTFRFISGKIADQKPDNVKVKTPLAIIGVRGTEYIGRVGVDVPGADAASTASKTDVTLLSGVIVVENDLGQQVISKPGFGVTIEPTGVISEPTRVSEKELDSKLQAVSTNEEDVKQEEESSDSEPSTEQSPAPAAEEDEPSGTSASSTEEEGAKTEEAPATESQETSTQESKTQESSSTDNTSSTEPTAEVAPVESATESTDNDSSAPEPASPSVTMNTEESDSGAATNSTSSTTTATSDSSSNTSVTSASTTNQATSTSVNAGGASTAEPFTANSTAGAPATYDSSAILAGSNDDYSFADGSDAPLQTAVYTPTATSDATSYDATANEPDAFTATETTTNASQTSTVNYLSTDTYDYSNSVATDDTFALATQVTADNTLQTTEDTAVATTNQSNSATSANALPSIYGFSNGTDINDPAKTTIFENNTYVGLISASDADVSDSDDLIYNIESGGDGDLFMLNNVRELVFRLPPDYEVTEDQDTNRIYEVNVSVTDGIDDDLKTLYVTVGNNPIIDSNSSINPFEGGITSTAESLIDELPSWSDFFVLAGTDTFDFQSIRFVDQCTATNFCMSDVVFSGSYNASSQLVDVSIQGEFSSSYGGVDGIFSATWDNHPISSFSGSSSSNFNDPNASAPPGTATFVSDINRLQAVFGTTSGVVGLDSDDSASITLTPAAAPNNTEYLVASQFQLAEDLRANTSYPYSAVGRVGVMEIQKDQYGTVIGDDFVDSSSFLGQSVPSNTTPTATSTGTTSW